jgi:hypothetical protein
MNTSSFILARDEWAALPEPVRNSLCWLSLSAKPCPPLGPSAVAAHISATKSPPHWGSPRSSALRALRDPLIQWVTSQWIRGRMRRREFSSLGEGNETTRIHHALWRCSGGMATRGAGAALKGHRLAFIRVCSDGPGYPALRLLCGASWVGDSPIASLERN